MYLYNVFRVQFWRVKQKKKVVEMQWLHDFYSIRFILILILFSHVFCNNIVDFFFNSFSLSFLFICISLLQIDKVHGIVLCASVFFLFVLLNILLESNRIEENKMRLLRKNGNNLSTIRKSKQWKASLLYWSQFAFFIVPSEFFPFEVCSFPSSFGQTDWQYLAHTHTDHDHDRESTTAREKCQE